MDMREIQDLTLQIERGTAAVDNAFNRCREEFNNWTTDRGYRIRTTAIPISPIFIEQIYGNGNICRPMLAMYGFIWGKEYLFEGPDGSLNWRPILRGARVEDAYANWSFRRQINCDGRIDYWLSVADENPILPEWIVSLASNSLCAAEVFRREAGAPNVEYALEFEIVIKRTAVPVNRYEAGMRYMGTLGPFPTGNVLFPRYSVGPPDEFPMVITVLERDFWNAAGHERSDRVVVDFARSFSGLIGNSRPPRPPAAGGA
jgi:hypothetical protein